MQESTGLVCTISPQFTEKSDLEKFWESLVQLRNKAFLVTSIEEEWIKVTVFICFAVLLHRDPGMWSARILRQGLGPVSVATGRPIGSVEQSTDSTKWTRPWDAVTLQIFQVLRWMCDFHSLWIHSLLGMANFWNKLLFSSLLARTLFTESCCIVWYKLFSGFSVSSLSFLLKLGMPMIGRGASIVLPNSTIWAVNGVRWAPSTGRDLESENKRMMDGIEYLNGSYEPMWASVKTSDVWFIMSPVMRCPNPVKRWEISKATEYHSFSQFWLQTKNPQAPLTCMWQAVADPNVLSHFKLLPSNLSGFRRDSQSDTKRYPVFATKHKPTQPAPRHIHSYHPPSWTPVAATPAPPAPPLPTKNSREKRQAVHTCELPHDPQNPASWKSEEKSPMLDVLKS